MEPMPRPVDVTRPAGHASGLARMEARRLGHHYLGPEHLLLGLLQDAEDPVEIDLAPRTDANASCSGCLTTAPTRSGCW